jgi:hypothetical protein
MKQNGQHKKEEVSIFAVDDKEFRRRIVDAINGLILRCNRFDRLIRDLDDSLNKLQQDVDDVSDDVDGLKNAI